MYCIRSFSRNSTHEITHQAFLPECLILYLLVSPSTIFQKLIGLKDLNHLGAIIGQVVVGLICDRIGRKAALVLTTVLIVLGAVLGTAAHGAHGSAAGLFWFLTFARCVLTWPTCARDLTANISIFRGITGIVCLVLNCLVPWIEDLIVGGRRGVPSLFNKCRWGCEWEDG